MSLDLDQSASPTVTSLAQLEAVLAGGERPPGTFLVGMEHEKIGVLDGTVEQVPYDGPRSIAQVLQRFARYGFTPFVDEGKPIAGVGDQRTISLEPGGQLELSGAPLRTALACKVELDRHLEQARAIGRELGIRWLGVGYRPFGRAAEQEQMPKTRYQLMSAYLPRHGARALDMMRMTATVQANFDFSSEADMARKMRTSMSVSSIVAALFANSFLVEGKDSGFASFRYAVWNEVDPARCGLLPFVFDEDFSYRRYVEWALDVPMIFLRRGGHYLPANGTTFRRFLAEGFQGHRATIGDFEDHLTTLFPEVRLKRVIEVRGADVGDAAMNAALPAIWRGILYDDGALTAAEALLAALTFDERLGLQRDVARCALAARCRVGTVHELARELLHIARAGLFAQQDGAPDVPLLEPLEGIVADGQTQADRTRARWEGELRRDPLRLVEALAY